MVAGVVLVIDSVDSVNFGSRDVVLDLTFLDDSVVVNGVVPSLFALLVVTFFSIDGISN